jgi:hypothetical protein
MTSAPQGPSANKHAAANNFAVRLALVLLLAALSASVGVAQTKTKNCECEFDTKDYEAYGTNGACGIFMSNKARTCEISIAGAGANLKLLKDALGESAINNQNRVASQIFEQYLAYEVGGTKGRFVDANFIETSLVVLERGALFRESSKKLPLKDIDTMFVEFSKKYSKQIAGTFGGAAEPFEVKWEKESVFSIGQGYVELNFQKIAKVRVVYFSEQPR